MATLMSGAEPEKMRTIGKGNFSGIQEATQLVVTNAAQWTEVWRKHSARKIPTEKAPEVDFEKETVIFVALGQKATGGHSAEISEVKSIDSKTEVLVKARAPRPGGIQLQAISAPFHAVAVPKISGEVEFRVEGTAP
jgi:hypothetical protein